MLVVDLGDGAVAGADNDVAVGDERNAVDALREEALRGPELLEERALQTHLDDVARARAQVRERVRRVDDGAREDALQLAEVDVRARDLLVHQVRRPDPRRIVVHAKQLVLLIVIEFDLVHDVVSDGLSANRLARSQIPNNERVIVLTTDGSEVEFVAREGEALDEHLVKLEGVQHF